MPRPKGLAHTSSAHQPGPQPSASDDPHPDTRGPRRAGNRPGGRARAPAGCSRRLPTRSSCRAEAPTTCAAGEQGKHVWSRASTCGGGGGCRGARHATICVRPDAVLEELPVLLEEREHLQGVERRLPHALGGRLGVELVLRAGAQRGGSVARWQGRGWNGLTTSSVKLSTLKSPVPALAGCLSAVCRITTFALRKALRSARSCASMSASLTVVSTRPKFRSRRTEVSVHMTGITAEIPVIRAGFRPETPVVDRDFGRKPRWSTRGLGVTRRGFRSGVAETTVVRIGVSTRPSRNPGEPAPQSPVGRSGLSGQKCGARDRNYGGGPL